MENRKDTLSLDLRREMFNAPFDLPTEKGIYHGCWISSMTIIFEPSAGIISEPVTPLENSSPFEEEQNQRK
jgi:hypothetical protein